MSLADLVDRDTGGRAEHRPRSTGARVGPGLLVAVLSTVAVYAVWRVFVDSAPGQRVDQAVLGGAVYGRTWLWPVAERVLNVVSVTFIAAVLLSSILIAVLRRRWSLAVQVAVLMGGANITTQLLKTAVLPRPDLGYAHFLFNTLPSGHTTAAASVSAALVFVVPPRVRPWAAAGGATYTALTGISTLVGQWHRPSDVVAAVFVVLAWSGLACALAAVASARQAATSTGALRRVTRRRSGDLTTVAAGFLLLVAAVAAVPGGAALRRMWLSTGEISTRRELLTAYVGGAAGIVAVTFAAFAVLLVLRRAAGRSRALDATAPGSGVHPA